MKRLLHIVPGYGLKKNAILDYANELAVVFRNYLLDTDFSNQQLPDVYMVSYVNTGYSFYEHYKNLQSIRVFQKKGIPGLVFFHEAFAAKGSFFSRSFWRYPLEKYFFRRYINSAKLIFCSCKPIFDHISEYLQNDKEIVIAPVPSNIICQKVTPWHNRDNVLIIFGTFGRRNAAVDNKGVLNNIIKELRVAEVIDIGEGEVDYTWLPSNVRLHILGYTASKEEVAIKLCAGKFGLISYPEHLLDKSGIFAAYAAAGLCIINMDSSAVTSPTGHTFSSNSILNTDINQFGEMSLRMISYYRNERSVDMHVTRILNSIVQ